MKKIFLLLVLLCNIHFNTHNQGFSVTLGTYTQAQTNTSCPRNVLGNGQGQSFWSGVENVFNQVGNALEAAWTAVKDFFDGGEESEEGWGDEPQDSADPPPFNWGSVDPYSTGPFDMSTYDPREYTEEEWAIMQAVATYYNDFFSYNSTSNSNNAPPVNPNYFIQVDGTEYKYRNGDTIAIPRGDSSQFYVGNSNSPYIVPTGILKWVEDGVFFRQEVRFCWIVGDSVTSSVAVVHNTDTLIKNTVEKYKLPTVYFDRGSNYQGDYAFDSSSHRYPAIVNNPRYRKGIEIDTINGRRYDVRWLGLQHEQTVSLKIRVENLDSKLKKDSAFRVYLKVNSDSTQLNGQDSLTFDYNSLSSLTSLSISSKRLTTGHDSLKTVKLIYVVTSNGDTIGKLNYSCQKPIVKKCVIVYANIGTGLRTDVSRSQILDSLNLRSHNQIFRKWAIDTAWSSGGKDTVDWTVQYNADTMLFKNPNRLYLGIRNLYLQNKDISISHDANNPALALMPDSNRIHYIFVFNYALPAPNDSLLAVTSNPPLFCLMWRKSNWKDFAHEAGHLFNLKEAFDGGHGIIKGTTRNFMDYYAAGQPDLSESFYFMQWVDAWW